MTNEDTEHVATADSGGESPEVDPGGSPRRDDRNEEIDQSPAPDPEQQGDASDDPEAD